MPGTSVPSWAPRRRATRRTTRTLYSSSSFVPRITCSTIVTAAISSEVSSASPKLPMCTSSDSQSPASTSTSASAISTSRKPVTSMNGSRIAARTGGSDRVEDPDHRRDDEGGARRLEVGPRHSQTETQTAAAATIHPTRTRTRPNRTFSGFQATRSP